MSPKVMASFSAFGSDLPSIAFIVLHSLEGSVLWSSVSTNCLHVFLRCSFVVLVISTFICCRAGEVGSLELRSSRALIFSNISAGTGSVLIRCRPEGCVSLAAIGTLEGDLAVPFALAGWVASSTVPARLVFPPACPGHGAKPLAVEALLLGLYEWSYSVSPVTPAEPCRVLLPVEHNLHHITISQLGRLGPNASCVLHPVLARLVEGAFP